MEFKDADWWVDMEPEESINGKGYHIAVGGADTEGQSIAFVYRDRNKKQTLANAHLIAAAPQMYEALKDIIDQAEKTHLPIGADLADSIRVFGRQAIEKADGKGP